MATTTSHFSNGFLSPYHQRLLLSISDFIFLLSFIFLTIHRCRRRSPEPEKEPLLTKLSSSPTTPLKLKLKLTIILLSFLTIFYTTLFTLSLFFSTSLQCPNLSSILLLLRLLSHLFSTSILLLTNPLPFSFLLFLRLFFFSSFFFNSFFSISSFFFTSLLFPDDFIILSLLPFSFFLLYLSITGVQPAPEASPATYATATLLSKATWSWMNPLLAKGYKTPLHLHDVPSLAPEHQAETLLQTFNSHWPENNLRRNHHPVATSLFLSFWPNLLLTAALSLLRLLAMYISPTLIQSFISFASSSTKSSMAEGYYLCSILLFSKLIEVFTSHQFNFQSQKLGMMIRSTLITSLYRKGLRLSCSSRQSHGVGMIVNYMAVDAQQLSDVMLQLHYLWLMPLQILTALALLYTYLGIAATTGIAGTLIATLFILLNTRRNNTFQFMLMTLRDARMKATNEMLANMRVIKLQAWERHFVEHIVGIRDGEFGWLSKFMYSMSTNMVVLWSSPAIIAVVVFGTSLLTGVKLDAAVVFTAMTIFRLLQEPMRNFPQALITVSQATVSLERVERFMMSRELDDKAVERVDGGHVAVEIRDGEFGWDDDDLHGSLKVLDVAIERGTLSAVVGTVGSGKSSLLACFLGEMHKISGTVRVCGTTAYVAQTAWIQNGTIQENILFGSPMKSEKYKEVIRVCCLEKDLEMMEFGDKTEIGERGINLSGGQKQRIQLARAVYQDCDIYLLDDVFSAVDAHTGSEIFKECVRGVLKEKTVVLVTHQVDFLHNADCILVMRDGMIVQSGKYDELLGSDTEFGVLVSAHENSMELVEQSTNHNISNDEHSKPDKQSIEEDRPGISPKTEKGTSKLIEEEQRETGHVSWNVYKVYITEAWGWWGVVIVLGISIVWQVSLMSSDYWLAYVTSEQNIVSFSPSLFIEVYCIIVAVSLIVVAVRSFLISYLGLKTAQIFFEQMLNCISHAPMSFFDTTPSGRILTRASSDQTNIDLFLPFFIGLTITMYITVITTVIVTCQVAWPTFIAVIPLAWLNIWYRGYYLATSRELTRLDSITKAPVIHHFSESILGVTTIRCFRKEESFAQENINRVNSSLRMDFHNNGSNEWLGFRLELIGSFVLCIVALLIIMLPANFIKPEYVGLSLSYGLNLNSALFFAVWISCFIENRMVSVERIKQFTKIPPEAAWEIKDRLPSPNWPARGDIVIQDLKVRYRPNTPLVLNSITLSIQGGEKIGVVGRTGGGKSTLIQAFFRLVEPCGGKIIVDGVDICTIGLHDLRSRFGIIPQEPILFQGTVRTNIDPVGKYSDEEIWQSLERCQLKDAVVSKPEKLDALVVDNGENWSVGQRQLLCLGRVMLKQSRILFMDEATASVDSHTDAVIQKIIREDFASCTIFSIAHRIPTVMDCDRVLVIDAGHAKEFDKPSKLIELNSLFGALVQEYANRSADT
ncbi:LOW QUALITY PROTEIN: ABC transporter C family member 14-like [Dioscorea cayenensis subsp. rotundata]|uniref:LOW QUALITY PROTEIN: ABC transporter C family member 14-like n=1 Tax=Dioscorea cayennensis subsp. rotundata TaxID=55577 RepID=A0AB40BJI0_DIOCR|nr:LOW QUALITY PROTEIN: ABC transporter C family member 14-like [Dioscorea cayenensis subsp. rotundata]